MAKTIESSDRKHRGLSKCSTKNSDVVEDAVAVTDLELFVVDTLPASPHCNVDNDEDAVDTTKEQLVPVGVADEGDGGGNDDNVGGKDTDGSKKRKRKLTWKKKSSFNWGVLWKVYQWTPVCQVWLHQR